MAKTNIETLMERMSFEAYRSDDPYVLLQGKPSMYAWLQDYKGVTVLGSGAYGIVFEFEGNVYKVIIKEDKSYLDFVDFVRQNKGNPLLPVIYGCWTYSGFTVLQLEKLSCARKVCGQFSEAAKSFVMYGVINDLYLTKNWIALFNKMNHIVKKSVEEYNKSPNNDLDYSCWDLHPGNFMLRGDQLVITDPWS